MSRVSHIIAGWSIAIGAIGLAALTFPVIAQQAKAEREHTYWQDRAAAFQAIEDNNVTGSDISTSSLARKLTDIYTDKTIKNTVMRDVKLLADLEFITRRDILQARYETRQHRCLSEAVYYEARSEKKSGQIAVAEVVLNRVKSKHYPSTICDVVYEGAERITGCQFSFTCDGSTLKEPYGKYWQNSQSIAQLILTGGAASITDRSTHYHTFAVMPHWSKTLKMTKAIGSHIFYRFRWRERPTPGPALRTAPPS